MSSWTRQVKLVVVLSLVVSLLAACTGGSKSELPDLPENGAGKITVMHWSADSFMSELGNTFNVKYPEIEFQVVESDEFYQSFKPQEGDADKKLAEFIKNKKIDVVLTHQMEYEQLAKAGVLYKLDTIIQDEKYPMDDFYPGIVDLLREKGGNAIYGLPSGINSMALFYNVDLFKKQGVEVPTHKMSPQRVLDLAQRFPGGSDEKERIYGIHTEYRSVGDHMLSLGEMSNLQVIDQKAEKVVMDSAAWKELFVSYAELMKDNKINMIDMNNQGGSYGTGFSAGKAAMVLGHTWMFEEMKYASRREGPDGKPSKPFEWNMVTVPVDPANPDESSSVGLGEIFAITNHATDKRAAWEFIEFTTGPEMAKINGRSTRKLTARKNYQKEKEGKSMEAFTMLRPAKNNYSLYSTLEKNDVSYEFSQTLTMKLDEALKSVADGKKSADQAYTELISELQKTLVEAKQKGAKEKEKTKK
ncbi:extracellular solute-binding protein [Paenibacillus sp. SC116]|uniref:ABC transporter substrate-binding protein n=1 Tax=Paenibacillus sp. SC116 TaxID=2968986 RepID=UPI00215A3F70|nr:extracellular solute-binding protein [Paenibacillus sp. SC116]MCR8846147.1 extracellular solute-binding protein [Paenibacillus sp. SC116]